MSESHAPTGIFGLLAEFDTPTDLVRAAKATYAGGYRNIDTYSPFPVEEAWEAIHHKHKLPVIVFIGGLTGTFTALGLQIWVSAITYPINSGGRPYISWPSFIPIAFELTVLFAAFSAVFGMIALNGLPLPYHPNFNIAEFSRASQDKFFLLIEATDPQFDANKSRHFMDSLRPNKVWEVPH
jgi:hypothetical protein